MAKDDMKDKQHDNYFDLGAAVSKPDIAKLKEDLDLDIENLTKAIDERIDLLFRPADEVESTLSVEQKEKEQEKTQEKLEPSSEVLNSVEAVKAPEAFKDLPESLADQEVRKVEPSNEISLSLEQVHIAYLALDWEFSEENLRKLREALDHLRDCLKPAEEVEDIYNILDTLLDLFAQDENNVSYTSMAILRDSLNLLSKIAQRKAGADERLALTQLKRRFDRYRSQLSLKASSVSRDVDEGGELSGGESEKLEGELEAAEEAESGIVHKVEAAGREEKIEEATEYIRTDRSSETRAELEEIFNRLNHLASLITQVQSSLERENKVLNKIRKVFEQRSKLKSVADYLLRIENNYVKYADQLKNLEKDLLVTLSELQKMVELKKVEPVSEKIGTEESIVIPEDVQRVLVVQVDGKLVGIPFAFVVRFCTVSRKKLVRIVKRGYGTLKDVKPFFRSIYYGVSDRWHRFSARELKNIKFPLLLRDEFSKTKDAVVFISDGHRYGLLLADALPEEEPETVMAFRAVEDREHVLGVADTFTGKRVEVLDIGSILPSMEEYS